MNTELFDQDEAIEPIPERNTVQMHIANFSADCKDRNIIPAKEVQDFLLDLYNLMN